MLVMQGKREGTVAVGFLDQNPSGATYYWFPLQDIASNSLLKLSLPANPVEALLKVDADGDGHVEAAFRPNFAQLPVSVYSPTYVRHGPNPIPPEGCIFWLNLPDDAVEATLKIFDVDGALLVSIPLDPTADRYPETGRSIPQDAQGRPLGTGLYLYCVELKHADGSVTCSPIQKMVVQR